MMRPKRNSRSSRSSQHSHECHQCMAPPERSASGRRLSLPMSLLQQPHVPGPAVGSPSFGAVARVKVVDQPFTEEPGDMDSGDQHVPTSPSVRARDLGAREEMAEGGGVHRRASRVSHASHASHASHVSPMLSPLPPPALGGEGKERCDASSASSVPADEKPYPDQETRRVPADEKPYPAHGRADPELGLGLVNEYEPCTLHRWAMEDVASMALVPCLVTQALSAGVLDATTYADFATFASNQTGNAIVLTLSAVGAARTLALLTGVSFAGFIAGAFIMGHLGNFFGPRRRAWLLFTTFWQVCLLLICAVFVSPHGPRGTRVGAENEWAVLFLFAHMSGAQVVMARQSSCQGKLVFLFAFFLLFLFPPLSSSKLTKFELPTAPMTSSLVDFVADQYLFRSWGNPKAQPRNRRIMYMVAMIGGSFFGAILHRWTASWVVIMVTILLKTLSGVLICFASPEN